MTKNKNEVLSNRLAEILGRLNDGERLQVADLADEFRVGIRTIERDIARLSFLPIEKTRGAFHIDPAYLGKLTFRDIERFAALAGLAGMFPALDLQFFKELFDSRLQETLTIHSQNFEDVKNRLPDFRNLREAIRNCRNVRFTYTKDNERKTVEASPYRLTHHDGVWYLAALDSGQPKSYALSKISALLTLDTEFKRDAKIVEMLNQEDSIWLNEKKTEAVLTVAPEVAIYLRRRKLIAQQVIEKELEDGGLLVSGRFAHPNQILPIVRYWLPYVIVSPAAWQEELENGLKAYTNG